RSYCLIRKMENRQTDRIIEITGMMTLIRYDMCRGVCGCYQSACVGVLPWVCISSAISTPRKNKLTTPSVLTFPHDVLFTSASDIISTKDYRGMQSYGNPSPTRICY